MIDYTTAIALDRKHLDQLKLTWPTWVEHKPELLEHPLLIIYDHEQIEFNQILSVVENHPHIMTQPWPIPGATYTRPQGKEERWYDVQRMKMLAGFVHGVANRVRTPYYLKIDTDTVATGQADWIDENWFNDNPAIVAPPWGYTKPPNQMLELDWWVERFAHLLPALTGQGTPPLNLQPKEGSSLVRHQRIISWCGFFHTEFTKKCSEYAIKTCGPGQLPVPSQDGFLWYMAARMKLPIVRPNMKALGWMHLSTMKGIKEAIDKQEFEQLEHDFLHNQFSEE